MEKIKAKLLSQTGNICIFETDGETLEGEQFEIAKVKKRRSLDANAYLWTLLQKQATKRNLLGMTVTNFDCYLESLKKYGQYTYTVVKQSAVEQFKQMWRECIDLGEIDINGQKGTQLQCFFGSSTYDSIEFTALLNGVIEDCKDLGIETMTPSELAKMISLMKVGKNG